jgi:hypothetical protein
VLIIFLLPFNVRIAEELGREVAIVDEAKEILGLN